MPVNPCHPSFHFIFHVSKYKYIASSYQDLGFRIGSGVFTLLPVRDLAALRIAEDFHAAGTEQAICPVLDNLVGVLGIEIGIKSLGFKLKSVGMEV